MTVFVAGSGRSGSNLLCDAMTSTGILGRPTEWLNLREMARRFPRLVSTAADCCRMVGENGATPNGIAATKLLANHFIRLGGQIELREWFPTQAWVYLRRKDRLGQAISRTIATQTGHWTSGLGAPRAANAPVYSREQIAANLAEVDQADAMWSTYFSAEQIAPLVLWYEELEHDLHDAVHRIAAHVGGEELAGQLAGTPPYIHGSFAIRHSRQRNEINAQWRVRYLIGN